MKRVLSLSALYPSEARPRFGAFVARSLEALAARGDWAVTVISPLAVPPVLMGRHRTLASAAHSGRENGVDVHRPLFRTLPLIGGRINPALMARAALAVAAPLHQERPFDLVDAQFFYPEGPAAARIAAALDLPLSIKARGADIHFWGAKAYARRAIVAAGRRAGGLLAVSDAMAADMQAIGLPREKITLHRTGLDRDLFRPLDHARLRARLGAEIGVDLPDGKPLFATVGALIERKGQALVIQALAQLPEAQLLLVGAGPQEAALRDLARDLGLAGRVHFLGSVDHTLLPLILSAADAMVLPSASEGLANAWVEALACGTPLVITDAGGAREIVTGPAAGRIVAREAPAIAEGIRAILADPPDPQQTARMAEDFDWRSHADRLAEHYDRLIADRT